MRCSVKLRVVIQIRTHTRWAAYAAGASTSRQYAHTLYDQSSVVLWPASMRGRVDVHTAWLSAAADCCARVDTVKLFGAYKLLWFGSVHRCHQRQASIVSVCIVGQNNPPLLRVTRRYKGSCLGCAKQYVIVCKPHHAARSLARCTQRGTHKNIAYETAYRWLCNRRGSRYYVRWDYILIPRHAHPHNPSWQLAAGSPMVCFVHWRRLAREWRQKRSALLDAHTRQRTHTHDQLGRHPWRSAPRSTSVDKLMVMHFGFPHWPCVRMVLPAGYEQHACSCTRADCQWHCGFIATAVGPAATGHMPTASWPFGFELGCWRLAVGAIATGSCVRWKCIRLQTVTKRYFITPITWIWKILLKTWQIKTWFVCGLSYPGMGGNVLFRTIQKIRHTRI